MHRVQAATRAGRSRVASRARTLWTPKGRVWASTDSAPSDPVDFNNGEAFNSRLDDLDFDLDPQPDIVTEASKNIDDIGVNLPIKDGLKHDGKDTLSDDEPDQVPRADDNDNTSEEERELPGQRRPKRGEGWWGYGRPLRAQKKGLAKDFTDGAGLPHPGAGRSRTDVCPTTTSPGHSRRSSGTPSLAWSPTCRVAP